VSKMLGISLEFMILSMFFIHFSSSGRDGPAQAMDEEACSSLVDDACTPVDTPLSNMTLYVIKSRRTSFTNSSTAVS
jgi:hypothetical protein